MGFIQIVECRATDVTALQQIGHEWKAATEGSRTARRSVLARDHHDPDRYVILVYFDSYESAMQNSQLPATQEFAEKMAATLTAPPVFDDLDVVEELL
jgi:quinol monooxygenase YgiN